MPVTLSIPGRREPSATAASRGAANTSEAAPVTHLLDDINVVAAYSLSPSARAAGAGKPQTFQAEDDDVLEIEVDGFALWTSAKRYEEQVRAFRPEAARDGTVVVDALPNPAGAARGEGDRGATAIRVLRWGKDRLEDQLKDPAVRQEFFEEFGLTLVGKVGSWVLAKALTWLVERQLRPRAGLYSWADATRELKRGDADPTPASFDGLDVKEPLLLFLHGTASSTRGSFGAFLREDAQPQWKELSGFFNGRIYALEHKTLSQSPVDNAIAVATALPARARLYLVSHSRGGLIGDLLCLPRLDAGQVASYTRHGEFDEADQYDRDRLLQLGRLLDEKQFRVERFARAACPARGTLLASENLDQFLSVVTNLLGYIPFLKTSASYEVAKRITLETAKRRWEPGMLPGLEAMVPTSPLVHLLNSTKGQASGSLGVIAGDIEGGSWLKRFGVFITDRAIYENRDHDLVVNTDSMFQGASRTLARYVFDQGSDVSHFNYFANQRTRSRVAQWITAKDAADLTDFRELEEAKIEPVPMARSAVSRAAAARPMVLLVPDVMGSDLFAGPDRIWLNHDALANGAFGRLADTGEKGRVRARGVIGEQYEPLHTYLSATFDVVPFAYDWRLSTINGAESLATMLGALLTESEQPVCILAHGAGGLLVRQLAVAGAGTAAGKIWSAYAARTGSRVVLLGTPHGGTHDAVELLLGIHPVAQQLGMLDPQLGPGGVINILQSWPGILELLPRDRKPSLFRPETWSAFSRDRRGAKPPDGKLLSRAQAATAALTAPLPGVEICQLFGVVPRTVYGVEPNGGRAVLELTTEGDGHVTHESSRLPNVPAWYFEASHGALANDKKGFGAISDLLSHGTTKQLSSTPPSAARGGEERRRTPSERVLYPAAADLLASVFDRVPQRAYSPETPAKLRVSVVHGDLTFARFPIMVGHYEGDTIIGPESLVDRIFDNALTRRYNLGLYPGALGTLAIVSREATELQQDLQLAGGAIVVGLGKWGELTAGQMANIVRRGVIEYVLHWSDRALHSGGGGARPLGARPLGISVLLIGATASNISTEDSVAAIMRGVAQANRELQSPDHTYTPVGDLEIVELYVDTAIAATRAVKKLASALGDELGLTIDAAPLLQRGRYGRVRLTAGRNADAWRRWEITIERTPRREEKLPDPLRKWLQEFTGREPQDPALLRALATMALATAEEVSNDRLRFITLSDRARAEVVIEQHQPGLVDRLIQSSITSTSYKETDARALFELLVPNDLKDGLGQLVNLVLVLDGDTAAYPWELMADGGKQPLCTRVRMVRQLQSATFREHIRATTTTAAFVVGDPLVTPPFRQLPGARREAQEVAAQLTRGGFDPTFVPPNATALEVLGGLFSRPFRILHLAGHGDYRRGLTADSSARSGMVLDSGAFLTAAEVRKMAQVPELVFLNCCSIGAVDSDAAVAPPNIAYNRLAASISRELIEMGVRAVVAAGWAVNDTAALHFARVFYDHMLAGDTFGRALFEARRTTWRQFEGTNTWGAYQAYGDPDFRLVRTTMPDTGVERVAHEELLEQIDRIWRRTQRVDRAQSVARTPQQVVAVEARRDEQVSDLNRLLEKVPAEWMKRSDLRVAIGEAYGELGRYAEAIDHLESALDTGELHSKTTIKAAEQLLNFVARQAERKRDLKALRKVIRRLEAMQHVGRTSERFNLLGGAHKRVAKLSKTPAQVRNSIRLSAANYQRAYEHDVTRGTIRHYPVVNWLALQAILRNAPGNWDALLKDAQLNARESFARDRTAPDAVFDAVAAADITVVRGLISGLLGKPGKVRDDQIARIAALYRDAFRLTHATLRQRESTTKQLEMLEFFMEKLGDQNRATGLMIRALKTIREQLV